MLDCSINATSGKHKLVPAVNQIIYATRYSSYKYFACKQYTQLFVQKVPWWLYCLIILQYVIIKYYKITKCWFFCMYACSTKIFSSPFSIKKKVFSNIYVGIYNKWHENIPTAMEMFVHLPICNKTINSIQNSFIVVWFSSVPPCRPCWMHFHVRCSHSYVFHNASFNE